LSTPPLSEVLAKQAIDTVNGALAAGFRASGNGRSPTAPAEAARRLGLDRGTFRHRLLSAERVHGLVPDWPDAQIKESALSGSIMPVQYAPAPQPIRPTGKRYILTSAQNNTKVHDAVWANLHALAKHYGARIMVSRFTYNKAAYGAKAVKPGTSQAADFDDAWYDERILPYVCDVRLEMAPGLVFCGEMNILPTAVRPLSGLESYTGRQSGIFPHPKFSMESVASGKNEATKFNWTTGTVTLRNYLGKKAGLKAEFHHAYGALLVEIDDAGEWFVRQLNARDSDGTIHDLDVKAEAGVVTTGHAVEAITWGDVHREQIDPEVERTSWGEGGMLDTLRPRFQFIHDLIDFRARNHHERDDPHRRFQRFIEGTDDVEAEFSRAARWLSETAYRDWCSTVVVDSNHDNAAERWLREADYRGDPTNALFFLDAQRAKYRAIAVGAVKTFHLVEWALRERGCPPETRFLREDENMVICPDAHGGIECGMHGHLGINGRRGAPAQFVKMGRKANTAHTHSAGIMDGVYTAGSSANLDMQYNVGPSSWSHSHIVTYVTGKRAIVTMWRGKWRA